jgi:hypothetical protein
MLKILYFYIHIIIFLQDGEVSCKAIECLPGCDVEGGQHVASGAQFSLGSDACTRCRCTEGKVECRAEPCPVQCSHGVLLPGSCCLDCTHCEYKVSCAFYDEH